MEKTFKFVGYESDLLKREFVFNYEIVSDLETLKFAEKIIVPNLPLSDVPTSIINRILDSVLLILGISYWKLYCFENIDLGDIKLTAEHADFWNNVYINGLGEFFYQNKIDFRKFNLFHSNITNIQPVKFERRDRVLLAVGGGKDSIVSAELLKASSKELTTFALGEYPIQKEIIKLMGVDSITIQRIIDPQLLELNKRPDVYNGHIPISAIYHFVGILTAALYNFRYVVFSNEKSANYGSVEYLGKQINHQWSKSFEFEKMLQNYVSNFITPDISPFSILRPMNEIKIVEIFSHYPKYFSVFSSCNKNFKQNMNSSTPLWCGECAKCLFVFVTLSAFLPKEKVLNIFGKNLFEKEELIAQYQELLGIKNHKPFDCVGTPEEVKLAFYLTYKKESYKKMPVMQMFYNKFSDHFDAIERSSNDLLLVSGENDVPEEFQKVLASL